MDSTSIGRLIIFIGIAVIVFGATVLLLAHLTGGRGAPLPGDIVLRWRNVRIFFPIVSSIVISIILTLLLWIIAAIRK